MYLRATRLTVHYSDSLSGCFAMNAARRNEETLHGYQQEWHAHMLGNAYASSFSIETWPLRERLTAVATQAACTRFNSRHLFA